MYDVTVVDTIENILYSWQGEGCWDSRADDYDYDTEKGLQGVWGGGLG